MSGVAIQTEIRTEGPKSFVESKERVNALSNQVTQEGLRHQMESFLGERVGLALSKPFTMKMREDGQFYIDDFPNIPLTELYAKPASDPIYDRRAPADVQYIRTLEDWARNTQASEFYWLQISPTTRLGNRQMTEESMFEIGRMYYGENGKREAEVRKLASPFVEGDDVGSTFDKLVKLGQAIDPESFSDLESELDFLTRPILFPAINGTDEVSIVNYIDSLLAYVNGGMEFKSGQIVGAEGYIPVEIQQDRFNNAIAKLNDEIENYVAACFNPEIGLPELQKFVRSIINQFHKYYEGKGDVEKAGNVEYWASQPVELISKGCGEYGDALRLFGTLPNIGVGPQPSSERPDAVKCDICQKVLKYVKNGDSSSYDPDLKCCGKSYGC